MLRGSRIAVLMLLASLVVACAPQVQTFTPTPVATSAAPKASSSPVQATTPKPAAEKPQRGGMLMYAMSAEPGELDAAKTTVGVTRRLARLMFNGLINTDKDGNIVPELAESWSNPDPKTYVFKLRKGVKFHDGTDFNADAVKFNIERLIGDPKTDPYQGSGHGRTMVANVKSVEVMDDYTVKFNLKTPQSSLLGNLTILTGGAMFSPTAVRKWDRETATHPVGTGPFEFVEWVKGDHITVKRFGGYWRKDEYGDPLPYLDQVIVKPIPDQSVLLTNLRTGNVDLTDELDPGQLAVVGADKNLKTVQWGSAQYIMYLNNATPAFENKALRQAVAWAIDRDAIVKSIYSGVGAAGKYMLNPRNWAFDPAGKFYKKDNAKAKEKLAEGGKPNGFKFVAKSTNTPLELRVAQAIKSQLAEVGIEMEIVPLVEQQLATERNDGKYEAAFARSSGLPADPDTLLYQYYHSKGRNYAKYHNSEVDDLLDKALTTYDQSERKALYGKVQALTLDDTPFVFVQEGPILSAMNQRVMGFAPNIDLYGLLLDWAWLKK